MQLLKNNKNKTSVGNLLKRLLFLLWKLFVGIISAILALILLYLVLGIFTLIITPTSVPIDLENGFIYAEHPGEENDTRMLTDINGNVIIQGDVETYVVVGKTVYGDRLIFGQSGGKIVYFICIFGEDCRDTQNYTEGELQAILKQRNLPPFGPGGVSRFILIWAGIERVFGYGAPKDFRVNVSTIND